MSTRETALSLAGEIIAGKNSHSSADLRKLEKELAGFGEQQLAGRIRDIRFRQDEQRLADIRERRETKPEKILELEGDLRKDKREKELAEASALRLEKDKELAGAFIGGQPLKVGSVLETKAAAQLEKRLAKDAAQADKEGRTDAARTLRDLVGRVRARRIKADEERAEVLLGSASASPEERLVLAKNLAQYKSFGLARRVLKRGRGEISRGKNGQIHVEYFQKSALYTYKDPDLPLQWRLDRAFRILSDEEPLVAEVGREVTRDTESLGLAGGIFKRMWEANGQRQNLERSLFYYLRGYAQCVPAGAPAELRDDVLKYLDAKEQEAPGSCTLDAAVDRGYNGINAAYALDLLAAQEEAEAAKVGVTSPTAAARRRYARLIRDEITRSVPPLLDIDGNDWLADEWWFYATVGEAYFGLGRYEDAKLWLMTKPEEAGLRVGFDAGKPAGLDVPEWEYESTARQLARLARLQYAPGLSEEEFEETEAGQALAEFLGENHEAVGSTFRGKYGLGLSGGGFRASFFHIGVLARLAELDLLRHVEVLSCVSGGSIVGAHYYLEVRKLLQERADGAVTPQDYIEIVKRVEERFLKGVKRNIRTRVAAGFFTNLKMVFWPGYSRTHRVGDLYERELYSEVEDVEVKDGQGVTVRGEDGRPAYRSPVTGRPSLRWVPGWLARPFGHHREPRLLGDLLIHPMEDDGTRDERFRPKDQNWRRKYKAPILFLNAASLNTGHNWQFTPTYMGEPPTPINAEIDGNYRLRRMYIKEAPRKHQGIRLGHAVAASSCVPGLFEPLILDDLYPERSVRLVDGGVCDNQGVYTLLEQDCTVMLVSDGSGQMDAQHLPSGNVLGVPLRSNSILQARIRESQYGDIRTRHRASLLRGLMFVHLKQDLTGEQVAWNDCLPKRRATDFDPEFSARERGETTFGVATDIQEKLAAVRTDLDSFSDAEAYALMTSGYLMTKTTLRRGQTGIDGADADVPTGKWDFLDIEGSMKPGGEHKARLGKLLDASASVPFKLWKVSPPFYVTKWLLLAVAAAWLVWQAARLYARECGPGGEACSPLRQAADGLLGSWLTYRNIVVAAAALLGLVFIGFIVNAVIAKKRDTKFKRVFRLRDSLVYVGSGLLGLLGWVFARLHLHLFDRWYLGYGKIRKFGGPKAR